MPDRSLARPAELESLAWSIVEAAPDAIVIVDAEGLIRVANDQTEVLFGWGREELIGKEIEMLIPADLRGGHVARRTEYGRAPVTRPMGAAQELSGLHRDGRQVPVDISLSTLHAGDAVWTIAMVRDTSTHVALERRVRDEQARTQLAEDRERLARDLHDNVIQEVFAIGLGLQGVAGRVDDPDLKPRIEAAVDDLDHVIGSIRSAIFELHRAPEDPEGVQHAVEEVVVRHRSSLSGSLSMEVLGDPRRVPAAIAHSLVAVLRESLSNIARHASAKETTVELEVEPRCVRLRVIDDGVGFDAELLEHRGGVSNMLERARLLGGSCTIESGAGGGTSVSWEAPIEEGVES